MGVLVVVYSYDIVINNDFHLDFYEARGVGSYLTNSAYCTTGCHADKKLFLLTENKALNV